MKEPYWFSREEVLALHEMLLADYGGGSGIRDENMLDSALAKPKQLYAYGKPRHQELAATYASGVIKNHPFVDVNKRAGFVLAVAFLERNGIPFRASEAESVIRTLARAAGELDEAGYATWLQENS
ncbi:type II toxin-antitoxin system death-on-curing family toxin [Pelagicoccus enzymogenes]|uniref:type II toxin-antitoxin system death-on-curing family toxin n=1 Tax=Pelagicoccus enzymogenes TaxID=2773457 RepID=UPI00280FFADB|nr:type II toxin-antitoxin system death-on-curing family toxin [Pelagicoccus enzymogenes]MDQ8199620.1 type II toxin-antitoxin system death-on-curing family toxin [Pelagicoccus enzymogenes]